MLGFEGFLNPILVGFFPAKSNKAKKQSICIIKDKYNVKKYEQIMYPISLETLQDENF